MYVHIHMCVTYKKCIYIYIYIRRASGPRRSEITEISSGGLPPGVLNKKYNDLKKNNELKSESTLKK